MPTPIWTIENAVTKEIFAASITRLTPNQRVAVGKPNFSFKWRAELNAFDRQTFKLTTVGNASIIHGLLSLSPDQGCVKMHLLESAL